jgi:hypothetical protein
LKDSPRKTDGMTLFITDIDRYHIDIRRIRKMGRPLCLGDWATVPGSVVAASGPAHEHPDCPVADGGAQPEGELGVHATGSVGAL